MLKIVVVFTCYNRKEKTEKCIRLLVEGNPQLQLEFVVVDDNSDDGTVEVLQSMQEKFNIYLIKGKGGLYYSRGMRVGMQCVLDRYKGNFDYILLVNDDVEFYQYSIEKLIEQNQKQADSVTVGATCNNKKMHSYGAIKYLSGISYEKVSIKDWGLPADTFNANCVLIPHDVFANVGIMDEHYVHSLGDFDYGLQIKHKGYKIYSSRIYVGMCENNAVEGTWKDTALNRKERMRLMESVKGAPTAQWFYFLKKNFGLRVALIRSITPILRILMGK